MLSGLVGENGSPDVGVDVLSVLVVSVVGRRSPNAVVRTRRGDLATELGPDGPGLSTGSPELRIGALPDLRGLRSVVAEARSLDRSTAASEANLGSLVAKLRTKLLDVRSAEGVADFRTILVKAGST